MGAPYEFNWYLVISTEKELRTVSNNVFSTVKSETRIYPINSEIPLIIKNKGCIGIVKVLNFKVSDNRTEIEFEYIKKLDTKDIIAEHYYEMYFYMKNN